MRIPHRHLRLNWREVEEWRQHPYLQLKSNGGQLIGSPQDGNSVLMVVVDYEPNAHVDTHYHLVDYASFVVRGSIEITRRIEEVGSMRFVSAGTAYGPLRAGEEGCTVVDVFALGAGGPELVRAQYLNRVDRPRTDVPKPD